MTALREQDVITVSKPAEVKRFDRMLADEHWLGAGHSVGHYLRQVVVRDDRWVAQPSRPSFLRGENSEKGLLQEKTMMGFLNPRLRLFSITLTTRQHTPAWRRGTPPSKMRYQEVLDDEKWAELRDAKRAKGERYVCKQVARS